jgi:hypothetical protein
VSKYKFDNRETAAVNTAMALYAIANELHDANIIANDNIDMKRTEYRIKGADDDNIQSKP